MNTSPAPVRPPGLSDERGVALPLALLGLVSVSLLVTTALVTSSTEMAISGAHQDATESLYIAEGGLQAFVAQFGPSIDETSPTVRYVPPGATAREAVIIRPIHLADRGISGGRTLRVFTLASRPEALGGREVSAMVRQIVEAPVPLKTNVQSAITLSGDLDVNGNAFTVNGRTVDACATGGGVQAVETAAGSDISVNNQNHWDNFKGVDDAGNATSGQGAIKDSGLSKEELGMRVLGLEPGQTLDDLISKIPANKKWGPRFTPEGQPLRVFSGTVNDSVAVVDGNGGFVDLDGGSGLLIIVNGHLRMRGNAAFEGIIIVEGNFDLAGTPTVAGALISLDKKIEGSTVGGNIIKLDESAIGAGHITVQYNLCNIQSAEDSFGKVTQFSQPKSVQATVAWMEVIR